MKRKLATGFGIGAVVFFIVAAFSPTTVTAEIPPYAGVLGEVGVIIIHVGEMTPDIARIAIAAKIRDKMIDDILGDTITPPSTAVPMTPTISPTTVPIYAPSFPIAI